MTKTTIAIITIQYIIMIYKGKQTKQQFNKIKIQLYNMGFSSLLLRKYINHFVKGVANLIINLVSHAHCE